MGIISFSFRDSTLDVINFEDNSIMEVAAGASFALFFVFIVGAVPNFYLNIYIYCRLEETFKINYYLLRIWSLLLYSYMAFILK